MPNEEQIAHWAGTGGEHWADQYERYDRMLAPFAARILDALKPAPGERILDVGCGNGALSLTIAPRLLPDGEAFGVDIATPMLERARQRAKDAEIGNANLVQADAEVATFEPASFDAWVSRFGIMFFDHPDIAFANIASALRPGGRVVFTCWRDLLVNEWLMVPAGAALQHIPMPDLGEAGGPGPFSLADADRINTLLSGAGLVDATITTVDEPTWMGDDGPDTLAFLRQTEMAATLFDGVDEDAAGRAWAAVAETMEGHAGPDGVVLNGSAWLVTARRAG